LIWLASAASPPLLEVIGRQGEVMERLSLFADGMVVWHSKGGLSVERLVREQLTPEELAVYRDAIEASKISALKEGDYTEGMEGPLQVQWTLTVALPGTRPRSYRGAGLTVKPLALGTVLAIAQDLRVALRDGMREVDPFEAREPRIGDILLDPEGARWQVRGIDADHGSLEMKGLDQPTTRYVKRQDLKKVFKGYADLPGHP
jgi:hypothetical protein